MISAILSRIIILVLGTLYPAYASFKAVRTKNVKEYVKWMMYWIVFALFTCAETFADMFLAFWMPFYYELKIIFVLWLLSPATKGASILYRKFIHPHLVKREQDIDSYIATASDKGYSAILEFGSKGFSYATNIVLSTAMKGQSKIADHIKKSYSLSDISDDRTDGIDYYRDDDEGEDDYDDESDNRMLHEQYEREMADLRRDRERRHTSQHTQEPGVDAKNDDPSSRPVRPRKAAYSHKDASHIGTLTRTRSHRGRPALNINKS